MAKTSPILLLRIWCDPKSALALTISQQNILIRQSVSASVCAQLWKRLVTQEATQKLCEKAKLHFLSAELVADRQVEQGKYEIAKLASLAVKNNLDFTLLKGAAYIATDLPNASGRLFSDIDLLIPKKDLNLAESDLMLQGFRRTEIEDYNEEYYRKWMHEIPPLRHNKRSVVLDLHHNILPLTVKSTPDIANLHQDAITLSNGLKTLSNTDILLHCAVHLFHEGEFEKGLRDLIDLDLLFRHFSAENEGFQRELINRATQLGLTYNLFLATYFCKLTLNTPFDENYLSKIMEFSPSKAKLLFLKSAFIETFIPHHASCETWRFKLARVLLYMRGHLIRMPLRLLVPHLCRKTIMALQEAYKKDEDKH
tara:strand:+ start:1955 stop:3058 length:1104 start_codon:yes stop_codon:yes gene_type:complete